MRHTLASALRTAWPKAVAFSFLERVPVRSLLHGLLAFALSTLVLAYIQFAGPNIVGNDGYYHIKMAALIHEQGVRVAFPWLPFTILDATGYTDHHMLLHVLQAPFTSIGDLGLASKWASVIFAAVTCTLFYALLRLYHVPYPLLWLVLLFASSSPFLYRMSMARGQVLSLALQLLAFHLIMRRHTIGIAIVSAVFVWAYNAFPLILLLVLFGIVAHYLADGKIAYHLLVSAGIGVLFGLIVNPYFPQNVLFLWDHIMPKLFATQYAAGVGTEWQPYNSWAFFTLSLGAHLAYLGALILTNREEWKQDPARVFWLFTATLYGLLLLKSRRFVEYFPPAAILLLALSVRDKLKAMDLTQLARTEARLGGLILASVLGMLLLQSTLSAAREDIRARPATNAYQGGADWLATHTPKGARVFHTDWDDFPRLFYFNTHNTYIVGLDPDFLRLKNERLFERWKAITRGKVRHPEDAILKEFGCEYVFTDQKHAEFIAVAERSTRMKRVYSDRDTRVYQVSERSAPDASR